MNVARFHIVFNHIPSLGTLLGFGMLAWAMLKKNEALKVLSFHLLSILAFATLLTYMTGNPARSLVNEKGVTSDIIEAHQNAAMLTLAAATISGTFAWLGLWEIRRFTKAGPLTTMATLVTTGATSGLLLFAAGLGGKISHPEIREVGEGADAAVTAVASWRAAVSEFMAIAWMWPTVETLHFIGMGLLFGILLLILLRMAGAMKSIPFSGIHRLLPLAIFGFVINTVTGMMFYISSPDGYFLKTGFQLKIACVFLAAIPVYYMTVAESPWSTGRNATASITAKLAAVSAFVFLLGVMIFGRLLPFFN